MCAIRAGQEVCATLICALLAALALRTCLNLIAPQSATCSPPAMATDGVGASLVTANAIPDGADPGAKGKYVATE